MELYPNLGNNKSGTQPSQESTQPVQETMHQTPVFSTTPNTPQAGVQSHELQQKLAQTIQKKLTANKTMLGGFFLMLIGAGLCSLLGDESTIIVGLIPLTLGLVLFLVSSIQMSRANASERSLQNKLASVDPSQFKPAHYGVGGVLGTIFLTLLTLAVIGVGGCFAVFGWGSML